MTAPRGADILSHGSGGTVKVDLVSLEFLRPHEETIPKKVDELEKMTHRWRAYVLPRW